jgi:hypothetical protein
MKENKFNQKLQHTFTLHRIFAVSYRKVLTYSCDAIYKLFTWEVFNCLKRKQI